MCGCAHLCVGVRVGVGVWMGSHSSCSNSTCVTKKLKVVFRKKKRVCGWFGWVGGGWVGCFLTRSIDRLDSIKHDFHKHASKLHKTLTTKKNFTVVWENQKYEHKNNKNLGSTDRAVCETTTFKQAENLDTLSARYKLYSISLVKTFQTLKLFRSLLKTSR